MFIPRQARNNSYRDRQFTERLTNRLSTITEQGKSQQGQHTQVFKTKSISDLSRRPFQRSQRRWTI